MVSHVLIIEDMPIIRDILCDMLHERWCVGVRSAEEGLELLGRQTFDVVITDLVMPEKEGLEVIMELRGRDRNVRIIAMSGAPVNRVDYLQLSMKLGADKVLRKPFDRAELNAALREALRPAEDVGNLLQFGVVP